VAFRFRVVTLQELETRARFFPARLSALKFPLFLSATISQHPLSTGRPSASSRAPRDALGGARYALPQTGARRAARPTNPRHIDHAVMATRRKGPDGMGNGSSSRSEKPQACSCLALVIRKLRGFSAPLVQRLCQRASCFSWRRYE